MRARVEDLAEAGKELRDLAAVRRAGVDEILPWARHAVAGAAEDLAAGFKDGRAGRCCGASGRSQRVNSRTSALHDISEKGWYWDRSAAAAQALECSQRQCTSNLGNSSAYGSRSPTCFAHLKTNTHEMCKDSSMLHVMLLHQSSSVQGSLLYPSSGRLRQSCQACSCPLLVQGGI